MPNQHTSTYSRHDFARVTQKNPCRICRKPDWCTYTKDGARAYCMREPSGSAWQVGNGAYVHLLQDDFTGRRQSTVSAPPIRECGTAEVERASADRLHEVYSYFLGDCLRLTSTHFEQLRHERGLSGVAIAANQYASTPGRDRWHVICHAMRERFGDRLYGVPGFFKHGGRWQFPRLKGFFVPYREVRGRIVGLQVRLDEPFAGNKYLWFSTPPERFSQGTSSGAPLHFVKPDMARHEGFAFVTEGALKADIIGDRLQAGTVALAGVSAVNAERFVKELSEALPEVRRLTVAFDQDWQENRAVAHALKRLLEALRGSPLQVNVLSWNATQGKGFDDVLNQAERKVA